MKKKYLAPKCLVHELELDTILLDLSMGIGGGQKGDNADAPIRVGWDDDEEDENESLW